MKDKIFLDTNFLVYLQNQGDREKYAHCRAVLQKLAPKSVFVLSTQVLQEFYVVMTRKMAIDPVQVKGIIHLLRQFEVVTIDAEAISQAIDLSILQQISFWDALIVTAAHRANCSLVLTEDLNAGQNIAGVRIVNPFDLTAS